MPASACPPPSSAATARPAARPFSTAGCTIVVSSYGATPSSRTPSNPATLTSSGTRRPSSSAARMTPTASRSLCAMIAVGRVRASASSSSPARLPSSIRLPAATRPRAARIDLAHAADAFGCGESGALRLALRGERSACPVRIERQGHECDIRMPEVLQVLGDGARRRAVVQRNVEHAVHRRGLDRDQRDAAPAQDGDRPVQARAAANQHDGIQWRGVHADDAVAGVGEQQESGPECGRFVREAVEHGDVHRIAEGVAESVLDDDPDDARPAAAQRLRPRGPGRRSSARRRRRAPARAWRPTPAPSR